jgi:arylsulfatase A-like enzyme
MEETLVIITSDHGEHFGERNLLGHGLSLYRPEVHVPLIVIGPRDVVPAGSVVREPVSLRDMPATLVDLLGGDPSAPFPGATLARWWRESGLSAGTAPGPVLSELEHRTKELPSDVPASSGPVAALVADGFVYIRTGHTGEEIFDLARDRGETANLVGARSAASVVSRLRNEINRLSGWVDARRPQAPGAMPAE